MNELAARWCAEQAVSQDDELVREFEAHLAACSTLAVRVAYSVVRNRSDAEDVAQEAFVRAYRRMRHLRDRTKFRAWLVRLTFRLALDCRRGDRRRSAREDTAARLSPRFGDAEHDAVERERHARLWSAIDRLPERLRLVLVLSAMEGHSLHDVAELIGVAEGTVKSRLFGARRRLQEILQ